MSSPTPTRRRRRPRPRPPTPVPTPTPVAGRGPVPPARALRAREGPPPRPPHGVRRGGRDDAGAGASACRNARAPPRVRRRAASGCCAWRTCRTTAPSRTAACRSTARSATRAASPLCRVRIFLRLYDDHGVLLSTGETTTDLKVVAAGRGRHVRRNREGARGPARLEREEARPPRRRAVRDELAARGPRRRPRSSTRATNAAERSPLRARCSSRLRRPRRRRRPRRTPTPTPTPTPVGARPRAAAHAAGRRARTASEDGRGPEGHVPDDHARPGGRGATPGADPSASPRAGRGCPGRRRAERRGRARRQRLERRRSSTPPAACAWRARSGTPGIRRSAAS